MIKRHEKLINREEINTIKSIMVNIASGKYYDLSNLPASIREKIENREISDEDIYIASKSKFANSIIDSVLQHACCANCNDDTKEISGKCGGCGITAYCGKKCQKKHWKFHKKECDKSKHKFTI